MTGAPPAVLVAFDTASTPDRISGAAHISASRVTSRRWALLPSPSTPDHTRFAVSLNGNTIGELGVRCRIAGARWSALVEVSGDMSDPEVSSGVGAFATAFADVVRATDPSLRQIAGTPSSSHPLPPPPSSTPTSAGGASCDRCVCTATAPVPAAASSTAASPTECRAGLRSDTGATSTAATAARRATPTASGSSGVRSAASGDTGAATRGVGARSPSSHVS